MPKRPWGNYRILHRQPGIQVKRIEIKPKSRFSLQKHFKRSEKWVIIAGIGKVTLGTRTLRVRPGVFVDVAKGQRHRMENTGRKPLVFIEIQFGKYLGEDDIVRFSDDFGRA